MGLLDSVLGAALGGGQQQQQGGLMGTLGSAVLSNMLSGGNQQQSASALSGVLNSLGGVGGVVSTLTKAGLAQQVNSWVGNGTNEAVSGDQISNAFGSNIMAQVAKHLGVEAPQASGLLAQLLPMLINALTPNGQVPASGAAASPQLNANDLMGMLGGLLGGKK